MQSAPDTPQPINYSSLLQQQQAMGDINQNTPYGNLSFTQSQPLYASGNPATTGSPTDPGTSTSTGTASGGYMQIDPSTGQYAYYDPTSGSYSTANPAGTGAQDYTGNPTGSPVAWTNPTATLSQTDTQQYLGSTYLNGINNMTGYGDMSPYSVGNAPTPQQYTAGQYNPGSFNPGTYQGPGQFNVGTFNPADNSDAINQTTQSAYNQAMALMQPQLQQQQQQVTQNIADRGLPQGSQLADALNNNFNQYQSGLESNAAYNAINQGQAEQQQLYNEQLGQFNTNTGAQEGAFNLNTGNALNTYDTNLQAGLGAFNANTQAGLGAFNSNNQFGLGATAANNSANLGAYSAQNQYGLGAYGENLGALTDYSNLYGSTMPTLGSFYSPSSVNTTGAASLAANQNQADYASQMQQYGANQSGLYGLGEAGLMALMLSDRRVKKAIKRIGTTENGLPIYTYKYIGSNQTQMGVMADEAKVLYPEAVHNVNGLDMVDYARIG